MAKRVNYRKLAFAHYDHLCAHCGFGIPAVLEVAHIDGNRHNNEIGNLVILCPNCHKMLDLDLISNEMIIEMRDRPKTVTWAKRMKDAGAKAANKRKRTLAARKAVETRKRNRLAKTDATGIVRTDGNSNGKV
ncbi:MAG TPA: HNH endonuclease [Pirellulaceae bacterium]|nr:HNH endonuclease [Pirellulaceae bacterium]HMO92584.1 HNH endonuclease [Pirellulaceae bacterium]HMP71463.1 HNH endonuclease [Pirellulaceae bacterium]